MRKFLPEDKRQFIVIGMIALVSLVSSLIVFLTISDEVKTIFIRLFFLHLVLSIALWFFCNRALKSLRGDDNKSLFKFKIFAFYLGVVIVGTYLITFLSFYLFTMLMQCSVPFTVYLKSALPIVLIVFIGNLMVDVIKMSKQKKTIQEQAELLKIMRDKAEISNLKMQTDSHFVYNFLNMISGSFSGETPEGRSMVANFTNIYRYSLDTFRQDWVLVEEELKTVDHYVKLIQISFPNSIQIRYDIETACRQSCMIPPFAIQLVVENAIKHNAHSVDNVLDIHIFVSSDKRFLHIVNGISRLTNEVVSTKVGLKNLNERYELLLQTGIEYFEEANHFIVKLPIIPVV